MLDAHDFISYIIIMHLISRVKFCNSMSRTVICSNPPWSSLVKYPYDKFKSGKIIFKEFNASIQFFHHCTHCHLSWPERFSLFNFKTFCLRPKPQSYLQGRHLFFPLFFLKLYFKRLRPSLCPIDSVTRMP